MADLNIAADVREITTKGAVNQLRKEEKVPGVLYSKEMEPINFSVPELVLNPVVYTTQMRMIDLKIGNNKKVKSILKDVQFDPVTDRIIHVDFLAITVGQVIQVQVPINFVGQSVGVKEGGRLLHNLHKFDVECLPKHIPQNLEVDITELNVGQSILVKDLSFENIVILNPENASVVAISVAREEEEEVATDEILEPTEAAQPEVIGKSKPEDEA